MPWPLSQDYNEAIQNPAQCFSDPDLKAGEALTNALGLPVPYSGNFADVYAVQSGQRKWAVKCFTRQISGLSERYAEISKHLQQTQLPFMVDFQFLELGIQVRGQWYPILKMQWVEGFTLNSLVRDNLDKPQVLRMLCQIWQRLAVWLREANMAHCDLQHGNVLLVPGARAGTVSVKLVDYDGMCVPTLEMLKSMEVGHPSYQHPQRLREGTYALHIDRFSILVIYTALRGLVVGGRALWDKFDNGDNLLFSQKDFEAPRESAIFQELIKLDDPEVKKLTQAVAIASQKPVEQVPLLDELVPQPKPQTSVVPASPPPAPPARKSKIDLPQAPPTPAVAEDNPFAAAIKGARRPTRYRSQRKRGTGVIVVFSLVAVGLIAVAAALLVGLREKKPVTEQEVVELQHSERATTKLRTTSASTNPVIFPKTQRDTLVEPKKQPDVEPVVQPESGDPPVRSATVGGSGGKAFSWTVEPGACLTGFAYRTRFNTEIACLQPIYRTPGGASRTAKGFGEEKDSQLHPNVEAREGYAVGALMLWSNEERGFNLLRGIKVQFMRRNGPALDPGDSYWSDWIGSRGEGKQTTTLGGDGKPIVGFHGRAGGCIDSLGIFQTGKAYPVASLTSAKAFAGKWEGPVEHYREVWTIQMEGNEISVSGVFLRDGMVVGGFRGRNVKVVKGELTFVQKFDKIPDGRPWIDGTDNTVKLAGKAISYTWKAAAGQTGTRTLSAVEDSASDIRIIAVIDGTDTLRLASTAATWRHGSGSWPTGVTINGMDWNPEKVRVLAAGGADLLLKQRVDFMSAKLNKIRGRGLVKLTTATDHLEVFFDDDATGGVDTYEVVITFGPPTNATAGNKEEVGKKSAIPGAARQVEVTKLVRKLFKEDYAKKSAADHLVLASKLLKQGSESQEDAATRFVLYRESATLAALAGKLPESFKAIDALVADFDISDSSLKADVLGRAADAVAAGADAKAFVNMILPVVDSVVALDDYEAAAGIASAAEIAAKKASSVPLMSLVVQRQQDVVKAKSFYTPVAAAIAKLKSNPEDAEANLLVGKHYCFGNGHWEDGLPLLALGSDEKLKELARKDLAGPSSVTDRISLAEKWSSLSGGYPRLPKNQILRRVRFWYEKASVDSTGATRTQLDKRLAELAKLIPPDDKAADSRPSKGVDLLKTVDVTKHSIQGTWHFDGKTLSSDSANSKLHMVAEHKGATSFLAIGLIVDKKHVVLFSWSKGATINPIKQIAGLSQIDGKDEDANETTRRGPTLRAGKSSEIICSVRKKAVRVTVDGITVINWNGDSARLSMNAYWAVPDKSNLFLCAHESEYRITRLEITPKQGK